MDPITLALSKTYTDANITAGDGIPLSTKAAANGVASLDADSRLVQAPYNLAPVFNVKDYGAMGDGTTDDQAAIQAALDAANSAGGGTVFLPAGTYALDTTDVDGNVLVVYSNTRVIGAGIGGTTLTLLDGAPNRTRVFIADIRSAIEFAHFTIDGNKARLAAGESGNLENEGIDLKTSTDVLIQGVEIRNCGQDAIDVDQGSRTIITNCLLRDNGGNGVHLRGTGVQEVTVSNCVIRNNAHDRLANASTGADEAAGIDVLGGFVTITNNVLHENARGVVVTPTNSPVNIAGNIIRMATGAAQSGIVITASVGDIGAINLANNNITGNDLYPCILIEGGRTVNVVGSAFFNHPGVQINSSTSNVLVSGCSFDGAGAGARYAVLVSDAAAWKVESCVVRSCAEGVRVEHGAGSVGGLRVTVATAHAVSVRSPAAGVLIQSVDAPDDPITLFAGASGCVVMNNHVSAVTDAATSSIVRNNVIGGAFIASGVS